jgi:hypothetical protein
MPTIKNFKRGSGLVNAKKMARKKRQKRAQRAGKR